MATDRGNQGGILIDSDWRWLGVVLAVASVCTLGCAPPHPPLGASHEPAPGPSRTSESPASPELEAVEPDAPSTPESDVAAPQPPPTEAAVFESLAVDGFDPAVVSVPQSGPFPKPLLVVAHGAGDRPEWHCDLWRQLFAARGFILCLRGRRLSTLVSHDRARYYLPNHPWLRRSVTAALQALKVTYGDRVDEKRAAFIGYSQGGIMGSLVIQRLAGKFARAVLIEGGFAEWNVPLTRRFVSSGGEKLLVVCGIRECHERARVTLSYMKRGGADARLVHVRGGGHRYDGEIAEAVRGQLDWFLEGDSRWGVAR